MVCWNMLISTLSLALKVLFSTHNFARICKRKTIEQSCRWKKRYSFYLFIQYYVYQKWCFSVSDISRNQELICLFFPFNCYRKYHWIQLIASTTYARQKYSIKHARCFVVKGSKVSDLTLKLKSYNHVCELLSFFLNDN